MAKRGRHRRGDNEKGSRPRHEDAGTAPTPSRHTHEPDLLTDVRHALRGGDPLELLEFVSTLISALDPRLEDPFERSRPADRDQPSLDDVVAAFLDAESPETSALLAVIAEMVDDEELRARIRRELLLRLPDLPAWLARLADVDVYRAVEMVHVFGDGDNLIVGARLRGGHELSVVVYIDHNVGTLVKDAYAAPAPIAELLDRMRAMTHDDPDTEWNDLDPADARVRITDAIAVAAMTYPPFESDTWPLARPLVEWIARRLPEGGHGYERPPWSEEAVAALAERFFASPLGVELDGANRRSLLESVLWFGTDYGPGDPMRWSPVAVEILLLDWIPRKILADASYLALAPELLRAFVTFCHRERGIRAALTEETLLAVDDFGPEYLEIVGAIGEQGRSEAWYAAMLDQLGDAVGGSDALHQLDTQPLLDESFAWHGIPDDVHARVAEMLALCDTCANSLDSVEYRTAFRRFLAVVARGDANVFRRKARAETGAAAVCWVVGKANDLFSPYGDGLYVKDLMEHFGLKENSSASQRAATMLRAGGFDSETGGQISLGSPRYLVSARRARIIEARDRFQAMRVE
jgi:Domain of unknown function (DUF6398)